MLTVTEQAKQELQTILTQNTENPLACLRLAPTGENQLGLRVDVATPDDFVVEYEGSSLLVLDNSLASALENVTLDIEESPEGTRLVVSAA